MNKNSKADEKSNVGTSFKLKNSNNFCFCSCYTTETILDSDLRRDTWYKLNPDHARKTMDDNNFLENFENQIVDPLRVIKHLYSKNDKSSIEMLKACRLNPDLDPSHSIRDDLEFYIPQLTNFIIFHEDFKNIDLNAFLQEACEINFFFSHLVYWSLHSLSKLITGKNTYEEFPIINEPLSCIVDICSEDTRNKILLAFLEINEMIGQFPKSQHYLECNEKTKEIIMNYGTINYKKIENYSNIEIKASQIDMKNYSSIYAENNQTSGFLSTVQFLDDLLKISDEIVHCDRKERNMTLKNNLKKINEKLPSAVYIPFFKNSIRNHAVLNILVDETIVFSTKERAPYYICVEIFRPEEDYAIEKHDIQDKSLSYKGDISLKSSKSTQKHNIHYLQFDKSLSKPITLRDNRIRHSSSIRNSKKENYSSFKSNIVEYNNMTDFDDQDENNKLNISKNDQRAIIREKSSENLQKDKTYPDIGYFYGDQISDSKSQTSQIKKSDNKISDINIEPNSSILSEEVIITNSFEIINQKSPNISPSIKKYKADPVFGEDSNEQKKRIKENSPFQHLKSWNIVHLIIKTHDNLKQEQFALQLIYQFDQIFRAEKLELKLRPYEVLSLGPDCGIIEMIKDAVTMDALKKKMHENYKSLNGLNQFFQFHFGKNYEKARHNFCSSLAAYSLVCYFLQIKDRHNGNILLHKDGYIVHIDFGFFLSNMPGKGLEFEKPVPFKLITDYLEVLGGRKSSLFGTFRKLFYKGFKAARKHKDKIILLVKMMYSSHGNTLPCFKSGIKCIQELEERFDPPKIKDDGDLNIYIQGLINQSIDNIRTKWYDKFQYYFQGIFY